MPRQRAWRALRQQIRQTATKAKHQEPKPKKKARRLPRRSMGARGRKGEPHRTTSTVVLAASDAVRARSCCISRDIRGITADGTVVKRLSPPRGANLKAGRKTPLFFVCNAVGFRAKVNCRDNVCIVGEHVSQARGESTSHSAGIL